ncbi:hypothetical protein GGQ79_000162 [Ochrobactrum pecoris]|uniref:Uncharacterized protein n=1 Tax=Brucella pecoris TaxID=867683 RepID=A0AB34YKY7_9HYPH|nr:hypothetical protein [Brucella pecoris]
MMEERFARFREGNAASPSFQKRHLACGFHVTQAFARSGKRQADLGRAMRDAAGISYGEKQAEVCEIKTHER